MYQRIPAPINPPYKGSLQRPQTYITTAGPHFKHWMRHDEG